METEYSLKKGKINCFKCEGHETECEHYRPVSEETEKCAYRQVADDDLRKFYQGKDNLVLISQFLEYQLDLMGESRRIS